MKKILLSLAIVTLVAGATIVATRAYFTSQDVLGTNTISTGTLKLDLNGENTKIIDLGNTTWMKPGDVSTPGEINIYNVGNEDFLWVGKFILTGDSQLPKVIYIKDMQMEFLKSDGTSTWETMDKFIEDGKGSGSWPSHFNTIADSDPLDVITLDTWINKYSGMIPPYPYFAGALKPGYIYRLTFTLAMHPSASNSYMNRTMGLGFQANATQIDAAAFTEMLSGLNTPTYPGQAAALVTWANTQISHQN